MASLDFFYGNFAAHSSVRREAWAFNRCCPASSVTAAILDRNKVALQTSKRWRDPNSLASPRGSYSAETWYSEPARHRLLLGLSPEGVEPTTDEGWKHDHAETLSRAASSLIASIGK